MRRLYSVRIWCVVDQYSEMILYMRRVFTSLGATDGYKQAYLRHKEKIKPWVEVAERQQQYLLEVLRSHRLSATVSS